jgi:MFS family permease
VLRPLRSRDYRLFWSGSLVANLGVWIQQTALGWLVYELTRRASLLGTIAFAGNAPILVLGLVGGAIADRASRRAIMLSTLGVLSASALALALLTASGHVVIWQIVAISMLAGSASALLGPTLQAIIPSIVGEGELLHAISLNSVQFNLARTTGPAIAGIAYARIGAAGCFALNAAAIAAMLVLIARVRVPPRVVGSAPPLARALREAVGYARRHAVIRPGLLLAGTMSFFGFPYIILMPAIARDVLGLEATGLGYLLAAIGAGAVAGGVALSAVGEASGGERVAARSALLFGLTLGAFAVVRTAVGIGILIFTLGALQTVAVASINTSIQLAVHDGMRGRVMSMMTVILFGFATTGALVIGFLGDRIGVPGALACGGTVILLVAGRSVARRGSAPEVREPLTHPRGHGIFAADQEVVRAADRVD